MIKINKTLNDSTGGTVPSGTIIRFEATFQKEGGLLQYRLFCYKSKAHYDSGKSAYVPIEITNFSPSIAVKGGDYDTLHIKQQNMKLKTIIEAMPDIGTGNASIVI